MYVRLINPFSSCSSVYTNSKPATPTTTKLFFVCFRCPYMYTILRCQCVSFIFVYFFLLISISSTLRQCSSESTKCKKKKYFYYSKWAFFYFPDKRLFVVVELHRHNHIRSQLVAVFVSYCRFRNAFTLLHTSKKKQQRP